jgi:hypothetical protein
VDPNKNEAIKDCPHPLTLKILCGFLFLTRYHENFIHNYGKIMAPLTALIKKNAFNWNATTDQDFQYLNDVMCTTPILSLPDFTKTFFFRI